MTIKILLVDDHHIVRDGLRTLLEKEPDMEVIGDAENGRVALTRAGELSPDVIVMDVSMPAMNGIEATLQLKSQHPDVKIVALSMHAEKKLIAEMLSAGAAGYLLKECTGEELVDAIRAVVDHKTYLSAQIAATVVEGFKQQYEMLHSSATSELTLREREVLQLLAEGRSTKEIAVELHTSISTVETHRKHLMDKLDIHTIAELTKFAIREGLTSLDRKTP